MKFQNLLTFLWTSSITLRIAFSFSFFKKFWMSVSAIGSKGSKVFRVFSASNFWEIFGRSIPLEPRSMCLWIQNVINWIEIKVSTHAWMSCVPVAVTLECRSFVACNTWEMVLSTLGISSEFWVSFVSFWACCNKELKSIFFTIFSNFSSQNKDPAKCKNAWHCEVSCDSVQTAVWKQAGFSKLILLFILKSHQLPEILWLII